jgi:vacuolar-type H+-ATPase subunit F/Vma7
MSATVFIGDELSAAGWRLAGVEVVTPPPTGVAAAFAEARRHADLVIVTAEYAAAIPTATLDAAIAAERPIVSIVADVLGRTQPPDLAGRLRSTLGIES